MFNQNPIKITYSSPIYCYVKTVFFEKKEKKLLDKMSTQLIAAFVEELRQKDEEIKKKDEEILHLKKELARQKLMIESDNNDSGMSSSEDMPEFQMIGPGINLKEEAKEGHHERPEEQCRMFDISLPLLDFDSVKNGTAHITPVTIPTDFLPLLLDNFDVLDAQGSAEKPKLTETKTKGKGRTKKFI